MAFSYKLTLNVTKTRFLAIGPRQKLISNVTEVPNIIKEIAVKPFSSTESLGVRVNVDQRLSWENQIKIIPVRKSQPLLLQ